MVPISFTKRGNPFPFPYFRVLDYLRPGRLDTERTDPVDSAGEEGRWLSDPGLLVGPGATSVRGEGLGGRRRSPKGRW